jgi:hypothetical protein
LDDFIDESNPVRAIDAFVDALNLVEMGFEGVEPAATGHRRRASQRGRDRGPPSDPRNANIADDRAEIYSARVMDAYFHHAKVTTGTSASEADGIPSAC